MHLVFSNNINGKFFIFMLCIEITNCMLLERISWFYFNVSINSSFFCHINKYKREKHRNKKILIIVDHYLQRQMRCELREIDSEDELCRSHSKGKQWRSYGVENQICSAIKIARLRSLLNTSKNIVSNLLLKLGRAIAVNKINVLKITHIVFHKEIT